MDSDPKLEGAALVAVAVAATIFLVILFHKPTDTSEPPYIPSVLPYVGHLIGLFRHNIRYYVKANERHRHSIFTLSVLTGRIYVVNSLDLISALQRHPKIFSFWYLEALFGKRLAAISGEAASKLMDNVHRDQGGVSLFDDGIKFLSKVLRPGDSLNEMSQAMLLTITASLARFDKRLDPASTVDLWQWIRHEITMGTTDATYGPLNPYRDPLLEKAFWDLSDNVSLLLLGIMPSVFTRKGYVGRRKLTNAFEKYFDDGGHAQASVMTQGRYDITKRHGISHRDMAHLESVQGVTILSNTVPSAFWVVFHVLSRPDVLSAIRERAQVLAQVEDNEGVSVRTIRISKLREDPIFSSVLQEALRYQSFGAATRMVMKDTMLDNRYLLKKGAMIMMPNEAIHSDNSIWGNAHEFNYQRFSNPTEKLPNGAFRAFGGGANLCPGRFFATTEILFVATIIALKYDIIPLEGEWVAPQPDLANMSSIVTPPLGKVPVSVTLRNAWEDSTWNFEV